MKSLLGLLVWVAGVLLCLHALACHDRRTIRLCFVSLCVQWGGMLLFFDGIGW